MGNNNDIQTQNPAAPISKSKQEATKPGILPKKGIKQSGYGLFRPAMTAIALTAITLAAYSTYQTWQSKALELDHKKTFDLAISKLTVQQDGIDRQVVALAKKWQGSEQALQTKVTNLNRHLQTALKQTLYQKQDWLLEKTRYFLELAQINAQWSTDPKTTAALLQQADALLQDMTQQQIYPVRQAIAKEIAALQSLPDIDFAGILSQLDAAQSLVSELPVNAGETISASTTPSDPEKIPPPGWRSRLQNSLNLLEKLVVISHYDADIKPMLSPLHQTLLRESVRLNLQEAQWAVLQNYPKIYAQSLQRAMKDIERAFDKKSAVTQSLIRQLQELLQKNLTVKKPAIGNSLILLNQLIDSKNTSSPLPSPANTGDE